MKDEQQPDLRVIAEAVWDAGANYASQFQPGEGLVSVPGDPQPDWDGQRAKDVAALTEAVQGYVREAAEDKAAIIKQWRVLYDHQTEQLHAVIGARDEQLRRAEAAEQREQALRDGLRDWMHKHASIERAALVDIARLLTAPATRAACSRCDWSGPETGDGRCPKCAALILATPSDPAVASSHILGYGRCMRCGASWSQELGGWRDATCRAAAPAGPQEQEKDEIGLPDKTGLMARIDAVFDEE